MARRGVVCCSLVIIGLFLVFSYLIELTAVTKLNHNYSSFKHHKDNTKTKELYNELRRSDDDNDVIDENDGLQTTTMTNRSTCEVIHIGLVCAGYKSNLFLYTMLKSLLFHRRNPLHLHIFTNKFSENFLRTLFDTWRISRLNVSLYEMNRFLPDIRWVPNSHYSGINGLYKLLFDKVLSMELEKIIILDADLTVISDIFDLWKLFDDFVYNQAIGLVENESQFYLSTKRKVWPAIGKGFNTGVILYRIDRLRSINWQAMWNRVTKRTAMTHGATSLGDQDIINAVLKQYPNLVHRVPCNWNTQLSINTNSEECYNSHQVKIIHWNSPKKQDVENRNGEYFRNIHTAFVEMNGNLVTSSLSDCRKYVNDEEKPERSSNTDVCHQFKSARSKKWRTWLFFRDFDYAPLNHDVTFMAQLSFDRLQMIDELAKHWQGPISLTLYVTDVEFDLAIKYIDASEELSERSNIAYHAVFKEGDYYPINFLRNVGLRNINTPFVFLADIDFQPMFGLHQTLRKHCELMKNMKRKAFIVPAFESQRYRGKFPRNKIKLLEMWELKKIQTFRADIWAPGHAATNYSRWKFATQPYTVKWRANFEPYIVVRKDVVEYDRGFVGFGWNKVSHIMELECLHYEFIVLHNAFIVHTPHSPSNDIVQFRKDSVYRMCLQVVKRHFIDGLKSKYDCVLEYKDADTDDTSHEP